MRETKTQRGKEFIHTHTALTTIPGSRQVIHGKLLNKGWSYRQSWTGAQARPQPLCASMWEQFCSRVSAMA